MSFEKAVCVNGIYFKKETPEGCLDKGDVTVYFFQYIFDIYQS